MTLHFNVLLPFPQFFQQQSVCFCKQNILSSTSSSSRNKLFRFLYSIDEASRTITNRTNSRGLRTEHWCTPTPTPKISLPLTFTLIVVSSYYTYYTLLFFTVTIQPCTSIYLGAHQRYLMYLPYHTLQRQFSHAFSISTKAIHKISLFWY